MLDFLNSNHPFFRFFAKIFWAIVFNLVFLLTSIPIITVGASYAGLYGVFLELSRERQPEGWFTVYFKTFKKNFIPATVYGIGGLLVMLVWILDIRFFYLIGGAYGIFACIVSVIAALFCLIMLNASFAVMVKYHLGIKETWKKTFYFFRAHPVKLFLGAFWFVLIVGGIFYCAVQDIILAWMIIMVFGLAALACSYCYNDVFALEDDEDEGDDEAGRYSAEEIRKYADMSAFVRDHDQK